MYSIIHRHRVHHVLTLLDMNLLWCNQLCNSSSWIMSMSHANGNKCVLTENLSDFTSLNILHHRKLTSVCLQVLGPSNAAWNQLAVRQTSAKRVLKKSVELTAADFRLILHKCRVRTHTHSQAHPLIIYLAYANVLSVNSSVMLLWSFFRSRSQHTELYEWQYQSAHHYNILTTHALTFLQTLMFSSGWFLRALVILCSASATVRSKFYHQIPAKRMTIRYPV